MSAGCIIAGCVDALVASTGRIHAERMPATSHSPAAPEIGRRIREARGLRNCTQEELAHLAHIDVGNIGRIERGEVLPRVESLLRIAAALELSAAHFVEDVTAAMLPEGREVFTVREFVAEKRRRGGR